MTQASIGHTAQPRLIVPIREFDPHDGDLILMLDDSPAACTGKTAPPLIAAFSKRISPSTHPPSTNGSVYISLTYNRENHLFLASKAAFLLTPESFGTGILPNLNYLALTHNAWIYPADRVFIGRDPVLSALKEDEKLKPYSPWFETHFP